MYQNGLDLQDLVNLGDWQKVQDSFSEVLSMPLRTTDLNGNTLISNPPLLCAKIPKHSPHFENFCGVHILKSELKRTTNMRDLTNLKCPFGLDLYVLPIRAFASKIVAYIVIGPIILNKRRDKIEYAEMAKALEMDPDDLMDVLVEISVFSYNKVRAIIQLLKDAFSYMAQTGYHKKRLGEIAPEVIQIDPSFARYYEEKVLNAFLNSCTLALDADSGSVMTVDKHTRSLRIRVATKLDQHIIDDTNIRVGEGIAGVAAATSEPIILPKDERRNGLAKKMKRKYIKSSMIVPFNKVDTHDVYGVINLNVLRKRKEFSKKDIAFVKELIKLAGIALIPVK
jgi:ligand-binding sensor protein